MIPVYTLSYDHSEYKGGGYLKYYKVVKVTASQLGSNITRWVAPPVHKDRDLLEVVIEENTLLHKILIKDGFYYREPLAREYVEDTIGGDGNETVVE